MENENNFIPENEQQGYVGQTIAAEEPVAENPAYDENYNPEPQAEYVPDYAYGAEQPVAPQSNKKKILLPIILGSGTLLLIIIAVFVIAVMGMLNNPQRYIEKGDYQKAYEVAKVDERDDILVENIAAIASADCVTKMKDGASFELDGAWMNAAADVIILRVRGNNSYGNKIINYWYYSYRDEDETFTYITNFADFDEEKVYSSDDDDEELEKKLKNMLKIIAKGIVENGEPVDAEIIDSVNSLFEADILDDVEFLNNEVKAFQAKKKAE